MSLTVLQTKDQIAQARASLVERGISALDPWLTRLARRVGLKGGVPVGDLVKSWDVEATLSFVQSRLPKTAAIADIGCFSSEVLVSLHMAGYSNLTGIDLNPRIDGMPFAGTVNYVVSDFMRTPLPAESFAGITSISVIEHGYDPEKLMTEVSRLLQADGFFVASFDYWPDKISTGETTFFGLPWLIFGRDDVLDLVAVAARHGLTPVGELKFGAKERAIECVGKKYTFAHLILQKRR